MRHRKAQRQLGRDHNARKALLRGLAGALVTHEKIETTVSKAKELQPITDKLITLGIDGSLHARRRALAFLNSRSIVAKLFDDIATRYTNPNGGYTRLIKTRIRKGDGATMAVIELVKMRLPEPDEKETKTKDAKEEKTA